MSGGQGIGGTVTNGIQDIAALLPLLGTEQCEDHVVSALTKGYLYAAATPLSIFGSLGVARAGFKTLLSGISVPQFHFDGPKILKDAGFKPQGENLGLIMLEQDEECLSADKRFRSMLDELHIEDSDRVGVSSEGWTWNITMLSATAFACIVSTIPYIHLNLHPNTLNYFVRWAFPLIRAIGGFLTATMIQLVIQDRVLSIMRKRLILKYCEGLGLEIQGDNKDGTLDRRFSLLDEKVERDLKGLSIAHHAEAGKNEERERLNDLHSRIITANGSLVWRVIFLGLLLIGIIASVVGYIGCFSVVQGSGTSKGALVWLCLEAGLSIIRIILWGLNPDWDDAPPLELTLKLDEHAPLPTCTKSAEEIEETKILPLVRAPAFLQAITSYAGVLTQFNDPSLSLYYTLTRRAAPTESSKRVLFITIFDHTEGTTRVYSEDCHLDPHTEDEDEVSVDLHASSSDATYFYSADSLTVDLKHGVLTTRIRRQMQEEDDPIARDHTLRTALTEHYHSILRQVDSGIDNCHPGHDILKNKWTLKSSAEKSLMQVLGDSDANEKETLMQELGDRSGSESMNIRRDRTYLEQRPFERDVGQLVRYRGEYIKDYARWLHRTIDLRYEFPNFSQEEALVEEQREMELILVDEIHEWENQLKDSRKTVVDWLRLYSNGGLDAKTNATLEKRWRTDMWERLKDGELAMIARVDAMKSSFWKRSKHRSVKETWERLTGGFNTYRSLFDLCNDTIPTSPCPSPRQRLEEALRNISGCHRGDEEDKETQRKMACRLRREVTDFEERLGSGLRDCRNTFSKDHIELTHSDSKWLKISSFDDTVMHALKRNGLEDVIHISVAPNPLDLEGVTRFFDNFISTSCTSIHFSDEIQIPATVQLPPNILSITGPRSQLEAHNERVKENRSDLEKTWKTTIEIANMTCDDANRRVFSSPNTGTPSFTLRFFGPKSSDRLILQLIHDCYASGLYLEVESQGLTFPIGSNELQDIVIHSKGRHPGLTFEPGARNTLTFIAPSSRYYLIDIELLDEKKRPYQPIGTM